jgi:hypothetical protein
MKCGYPLVGGYCDNMCDPVENGSMVMMEPTFRTIDEEILRHAENCVSIGLDHLRSLLAHHDHDGYDGPNTVWRRSWRDRLTTDIAALERSKAELRKSMGWEK